jgi:geranylgeranyl diphosphate synthase type II
MDKYNINSYINDIKVRVDKELADFYKVRDKKSAKIGAEYKRLIEETSKQALRGGKRLRPALAVLGYEIAGGKERNKIIKASIALEIFHNYLLIHDDIMDRDERRHGGLNILGSYKRKLSKLMHESEAEHTAMSFAISAGDINSGLMYEALLESGFSNDNILKAITRINEAVFEVAAGQQLDMIASYKKIISEKDIIAVARHKTADYSIILPLQFGAILAGADKETIESMNKFGQPLGIGYQIIDDVIGIYGSQQAIGKPVLSDLQEGKKTILIRNGLKLASSDQKRRILSVFGNSRANLADLKMVKKYLDDSGAKAKTLISAQDYVKEAIDAIPEITSDESLQKLLSEFANYCMTRNK